MKRPFFPPPEFSLPEAEAGGAGARGENIVIPLAITSYIVGINVYIKIITCYY